MTQMKYQRGDEANEREDQRNRDDVGRRPESGSEGLGERDVRILEDLGRVRLLTGRHVQRLHVAEGSPLTQARRTRSILQRLSDQGWVNRLERRIGGVRAGSAGFTYALSARGQRFVTGLGPARGRRLRRVWEPSIAFMDHMLAVSECYVRLRELEMAGQLEELEFQAEPACWRYWVGGGGQRLVLKPDAFVRYGQGEYEHSLFVEVDRDSQSQTVIRRKGEVYRDYYRSGQEQRRYEVFPKVLFVTVDDHRREQIVDALSRLDPELWQLFQVQTMREAFMELNSSL